ncbi:YpmA family protein [Desulfitobacterium sp. THU1]|uniref:YpmA family protein n=1 Tax=Desulfitobacterium sp. THU1 TaxID=3138072 RepID=UPI00311E0168
MDRKSGKIELIGTQKLKINSELYKVVDFLNKNLKEHHLMFGLSKKEDTMTISVYEVE